MTKPTELFVRGILQRLGITLFAAADSGMCVCLMQSARETLENAIRMVEASSRWKARVVYGDTDSMFVLLPGR